MSFWANLFSSSKDRFSLDELHRLHSVLLRNQVVTDGNRETVVETLRAIAELTIWGDQHDPSMVEYFLTENMLGHFHQILLQRSARRGTVAIQVLQTLSILIQNIRNQQTIYYLFSNDHINNIAALKFDFEDDEVLGYYVNLLKTISFRLNETTVQFFFRAGGHANGDGGTTPISPGTPSSSPPASFPLYTEAVKFVAHRDGMVRAAVKTLTLNVFAIQLPSLREFLSSPPSDVLYDNLATYTAERCTALDRLLSSWDATAPRMAATVETYLAEIEDIFSFANDVFAVGVPAISSLLLGHLWKKVVGPVLFWPLLDDGNIATMEGEEDVFTRGAAKEVDGTVKEAAMMARAVGEEEASRSSPKLQKSLVGPLCSLYAFERALYAVTDPFLSSLLVSALLGGPAKKDAAALATSLVQINNEGAHMMTGTGTAANTSFADSPLCPLQQQTYKLEASDFLLGLQANSKTYRTAVLSMLRGGDAQLAAAVVRLLAAVLSRKNLSEETTEAVGLLPRRRRKQRKLLEELTKDASSFCEIQQQQQPQLNNVSDSKGVHGTSSSLAVAATEVCAGTATAAEDPLLIPQTLSQGSSPASSSGRSPGLRRYSPTDESVLHIPPESTTANNKNNNNNSTAAAAAAKIKTETTAPIASTLRGEEHFNEIVDSLLIALNLDLLPPLSLPVIGWALHRLLASDAGPAELSSEQKILLETAWMKRKQATAAVRAGSWGDAVVPMVAQIWSRIRETVLRTGPGPVHVAGHTWVQAVLVHELHWQLGGGGGDGSRSTDSLIKNAANIAAEEVTASNFAVSAKVATVRVATWVAVAQVHGALSTGQVPLHISKHPFSSSGNSSIGSVSSFNYSTILADISAGEIREGSVVPLPKNESERMQCKVAFSRGVERVVMMCVLGLLSSQDTTNTDIDNTAATATEKEDSTFIIPFSTSVSASPVVAILDPGTGSTLEYGTILSVAPLLAAAPAVDPDHPQWLHVHVRPQRSALLRLLGTGGGLSGAELAAMDEQLAEGHWVLAFPDGEAAKKAAERVVQSANALREVHQKALDPMCEL
ncbi:hypothetical protein Ndes2526B_g08810 [Nannochloris sp. 'desiccata']|nr:putative Protein CLEC16A-like protein [Chlorella desiccata (nom. nud.)]